MKQSHLIIIVISLIAILNSTPGNAIWQEGGNVLSNPNDAPRNVHSVSDGTGNSFIVWCDYRSGNNREVYVQKLDANGNKLWSAGDVAVASGTGYQTEPRAFSDGDGGIVITWQEFQSGPTYSLKAQRLDGEGNLLWANEGQTLVSSSISIVAPKVISDAMGGVIATWYDYRSGNYDIYAQRINVLGNNVWTTGGVAICNNANSQFQPKICADGESGAFIAWQDYRNSHYDVYVQRVDNSGLLHGGSAGVPVGNLTSSQKVTSLVPDGSGGAIISWDDARNGSIDIYSQRVDADLASQWYFNGIPVCSASGDNYSSVGIADGNSGAIFVWSDNRTGTDDIYAQRISHDGNLAWTIDGVKVCDAPTLESDPDLLLTANDNVVIAWLDARSDNTQVYAQMFDLAGSFQLLDNGVPLSSNDLSVLQFNISTDDAGGVIIPFQIDNLGENNIHAQRLENNGYWGYPAPNIVSINDVPEDQGDAVSLHWQASRLDAMPEMTITNYSIWRVVDTSKAKALSNRADWDWQMLFTVDADYESDYTAIASTHYDSTSYSIEYCYFRIIAHTEDSTVFWTSAPDSGYSVDNLAPVSPINFTGSASYQPSGLLMSWDPNQELDLAEYALFRSNTAEFMPSAENQISATSDTTFFDEAWTIEGHFYYKLAAIDYHENISHFAVLDLATISRAGDDIQPWSAHLAGNFPNPFNPATVIVFYLPADEEASLSVYNIGGHLVRTLLAGEMARQGRNEIVWDGRDHAGHLVHSGTYLYQLQTGAGHVEAGKMVLLK